MSPTPLSRRHAVIPRRPPGRHTRPSSAATRAWSGAKMTPTDDETTSNDASAYGSCWASATSSVKSSPNSRALRCAVSINVGERSDPVTIAPARAAWNATSPVPAGPVSDLSAVLDRRRIDARAERTDPNRVVAAGGRVIPARCDNASIRCHDLTDDAVVRRRRRQRDLDAGRPGHGHRPVCVTATVSHGPRNRGRACEGGGRQDATGGPDGRGQPECTSRCAHLAPSRLSFVRSKRSTGAARYVRFSACGTKWYGSCRRGNRRRPGSR